MKPSPEMPTLPMLMNNLVEIVDRQNSIIHLQSETINELFQLLAQHLTLEELEKLPCIARINQAATLQAENE